MSVIDAMQPGDPVWYRQTDFGGGRDVPGEFVKRTPKRVTVRLFRPSGEPVEVHVRAWRVRPRTHPSASQAHPPNEREDK